MGGPAPAGLVTRPVMVRTAHTAELDADTRQAVQALLDDAFDGHFDADDWEHALGGVHALVAADGALLAHGALVQRRLLTGGRTLRAGYVEAVAVRASARRRGLGTAVMAALESFGPGFDLLALSASEQGVGLYESRGWRRWRGPTSALTPSGVVATPDDDGSVYVLPGTRALDLDAPLTCDWREGDVW